MAIVVCAVGGAVLAVVGAVFSIRGKGGATGPIMAVTGLLLVALAWFLLQGGGLRWALRRVGLDELLDDDSRP